VLLARTRRVEDQQQTTINWLNPGDATNLETTLAYEQVAIDLTGYLARHEPDPYVRHCTSGCSKTSTLCIATAS